MRAILGVLLILMMVLVALFATSALMGEQARAPDPVVATENNTNGYATDFLVLLRPQTENAEQLVGAVTVRTNIAQISNQYDAKSTLLNLGAQCLEVTTLLKCPSSRTPQLDIEDPTSRKTLLLTAERRRTTWKT